MGKFDTHIGESKEYEIDGEKYLFKPLTISYLPKFFKVMKAFSKTKDDDDILENLTPEVGETLSELISAMLQKSYPDIEEDKRNEFALAHFSMLIMLLFEVNGFNQQDNEALEKINTLKERLKANKSEQKPKQT